MTSDGDGGDNGGPEKIELSPGKVARRIRDNVVLKHRKGNSTNRVSIDREQYERIGELFDDDDTDSLAPAEAKALWENFDALEAAASRVADRLGSVSRRVAVDVTLKQREPGESGTEVVAEKSLEVTEEHVVHSFTEGGYELEVRTGPIEWNVEEDDGDA